MHIIKLDKLSVMHRNENANFHAKKVLENEHVKVMNIIVDEGGNVPVHSVPVHVFFYVVEGRGSIQIGDKKSIVSEKDIVECPANTGMSLCADQGDRLVVLNVKTPSYNPPQN